MNRTKLRKQPINKDNNNITTKTKSNTRKISQQIPDYYIPKNISQLYESSGSQSSNNNSHNININKKKSPSKPNKFKDDYMPFALNTDCRKVHNNSTNTTRKKIFPVKSDSSVEAQNIVNRQQYEQNRPSTAATSQRKKHMHHSEYVVNEKEDINEENEFMILEESDTDNCFQIIKDAIEEVVQSSLKKILSTQMPVINQKLEQVHSYIKKNEDDMTNCFKELESRITHYGEDQGRHIRYLCMKLEFDKLLHNHLGVATSSAQIRCCQNNNLKTKSHTSCLSQRNYQQHQRQHQHQQQQHQHQQQQYQQHQHQQQQYQQQQQLSQQQHHQKLQPKNSCSCCFDNHRLDQTLHTEGSVRCSSARLSTMRGGSGHYDILQLHATEPGSECQKIDLRSNLHECGDYNQQQDLNNKSVLSILEELKKRNSTDLKTSSLLKTNRTIHNINSEDSNNLYTTQNGSSETTDVGLKDILATIQKYYPIVDQNVIDDIRQANNEQSRIDMNLEIPVTQRSYEE